jgi:DNA-binding winged helix-turn-helix (wHTH) protein/TolB-like protein
MKRAHREKRGAKLQSKPSYNFGPYRLDTAERVLTRAGSPLSLTPKAFDTLLALVENNGRILEKDALMKRVWPDAFVEEANLAVNISSLRKALGEKQGGGQYIETIPRRGYRFMAEVRETYDDRPSGIIRERAEQRAVGENSLNAETRVAAAATSSSGQTSLPEREASDKFVAPVWKRKSVLLLALILLLASISYWIVKRGTATPALAQPRSLAILPFRNLKPDPETDFIGGALAETITTKLGYVTSISAVNVRPASYVEKYRNQPIEPKRFAKELNVDTLLTGAYVKEGNDLRINVELIDVKNDATLWNKEINIKYDRLLTVQDQVSQQIIGGLQVNLSSAEAELFNRDSPTNPDAYEKFLRGVDHYQTNRFKTSLELLEKSVELNPDFALAWAHLGRAYSANAAFQLGGEPSYKKALACYDRALKLNPEQIEAHIYKANLLTDTGRAGEAIPSLREVLKTNPNLAEAHWELGYAYRFGGMLEQSISECELARRLNPEVKLYSSALNAYLYHRDYDKFIKSLPETDVAFIVFYRGLGNYYEGNLKQAAAYFDRALELSDELYTRTGKALSYGINGENQKGLNLLLDTRQMIEERGVGDAEGIYKVAQAYSALGDKASAIRMLRYSIERGFFCYPYFQNDPLLENVRGETEFAALMEIAREKHEEFKSKFS